MSFGVQFNVPITETTRDMPVRVYEQETTLGEIAAVALVMLAVQMSFEGADPNNPLFSEVAIPITYI